MSTYECTMGKIQCLVEFSQEGEPLRVSSRVKGRTGARDSTRVLWWRNAGKAQSPTVGLAIQYAEKLRSADTSSVPFSNNGENDNG